MRGSGIPTETLHCVVGKPFSIRLPVSPTAGYKWTAADPLSICRVTNERIELSPDMRYGGSSTVVFTLVATRPGAEVLKFVMQRPWEDEIAGEHYVRVVAGAETP